MLAQFDAQGAQDITARMIALKRHMDTLSDPGAVFNEYPNAPWNTTRYDWSGIYPPDSQEYRAQFNARLALALGLQFNTTPDRYGRPGRAQQGEQEAQEETQQGEQEPAQAPLHVYNGVLTDSELIIMQHGKLARLALSQPMQHAGDIWQLCLDYQLRAIWVVAGSEISERATKDFIEAARPGWEVQAVSYTRGPGEHTPMCKYAMGYRKGYASCSVSFAGHNDRWDVDTVTNPLLLLATITYIEDAIKYRAIFSPGRTGQQLIQRKNTGERANWIRPVPELATIAPIVDTGVNDLNWKRPLSEQEAQGGYCIVGFDKSSQYTASCTSALLGEGAPRWVAVPHFDMKHLRPGVYKCTITGESEWNGAALPHPTDGVTSGWFWAYTVKLLLELGYTVAIDEAWIWEHKQAHTTLRAWAETIWNATRALKEDTTRYSNAQARALAYDNSKNIGRHAIGLLNRPPDDTTRPGAYSGYRPDWNRLIIDNARYLISRRIMKYAAMGFIPLGVHVDCIFYAIPTNDVNAIPDMLDRAGMLGGFKVKHANLGAIPITEEIAAWFANPALDMSEINERLNRIDRNASTRKDV